MNNEKIDIQSGQENEPDSNIYPVRDVIEALSYFEEQSSSEQAPSRGMDTAEYIEWMAHVLEFGLPGSDLIGNIEDLDNMTFDESQSVIVKVKPMIDEARALLVSAYKQGVGETISELNSFIIANPGLFIIDNPQGSIIANLGADWVGDVAHLTVNAAAYDGGHSVYIDVSGLDDDYKKKISEYRAELEL